MRISKPTIIYAVCLVLSASFLRQVLRFFYNALGKSNIVILLWLSFALLGFFFLISLWKYSQKEKKVLLIIRFVLMILIFFAGIYYASTFNIPEERIHLVKYGILGWLISKDNFSKWNYWSVPLAVLFCLVVAGIDETFQYFLPTRVGDIRDVGFGGIGGLWGSLFHLTIFLKR